MKEVAARHHHLQPCAGAQSRLGYNSPPLNDYSVVTVAAIEKITQDGLDLRDGSNLTPVSTRSEAVFLGCRRCRVRLATVMRNVRISVSNPPFHHRHHRAVSDPRLVQKSRGVWSGKNENIASVQHGWAQCLLGKLRCAGSSSHQYLQPGARLR
ncbi:hypothetical protein BKA80DRAFT_23632 [Phyllosticta citrichinensis]